MKNSKFTRLAGALCLLMLISIQPALAAARSNAGIDYLFRNPSLGRFTAGFYGGQVRRDVSPSGSPFETQITSDRYYGYLGVDILPWMNLYGILGSNQAKLSNTTVAESEMLYGAGLSFNLLNHFIREPTPMEDVIRINGDLRIVSTKSDLPIGEVSWQEISASLRFSLVNFPVGDKAYRPEAIALYIGPAYSYIASSEVEASQKFGAIGGLEIFFYESLSLDLMVEYYDTASVFGGLNLRF